MMASDQRMQQAAALPFRKGKICLVTTSSGQGMIIPKGKIPLGVHPSALAAREAWEEAGLIGRIGRKQFGIYSFIKSGQEFTVKVYLLEVTKWASTWPEQQLRKRIWCSVDNAIDSVSHIGLRPLLEQLKKRHLTKNVNAILHEDSRAA
jgi:8-oxo-dGTP pyrophosphatase MutT (NUDIX family)